MKNIIENDKLSYRAKILAIVLKEYAVDDVVRGIKRVNLRQLTSLCNSAHQRALDELQEKKLVEVVEVFQKRRGGKMPNEYYLNY